MKVTCKSFDGNGLCFLATKCAADDFTSFVIDTGRKCATDFEVLEVYADHSSPEVMRQVALLHKFKFLAPKFDFVGTVFRDLRPNQLIYPFEIFFVSSSDLCATGISISPL